MVLEVFVAASTALSFTSPLEGEIDRAKRGREGGGYTRQSFSELPPSLTLPRKGGGNAVCLWRELS